MMTPLRPPGEMDARRDHDVQPRAFSGAPPRPLTPPQERALRYIVAYLAEYGQPPTVRELCDGLGFSSTHSGACVLAALERKGFITRRLTKARGIKVIRQPSGPAPGKGTTT